MTRLTLLLCTCFLVAPVAAQTEEQLAKADRDGNGTIEWQEIIDMRNNAFARLDRNADSFIDLNDKPSIGPMARRFGDAWQKLQPADTNNDQKISREEMLNAPAPLFDSGDLNKDGKLSEEELSELRAGVGNKKQIECIY